MKAKLLSIIFVLSAISEAVAEKFPTRDEVAAANNEFMALPRPFSYVSSREGDFVGGYYATIQLEGATKAYADRHSGPALIHALWNFLDHPDHAVEAVVIIMGKSGAVHLGVPALNYVSPDQPGNWAETKEGWVWSARLDGKEFVDAFHDDFWYPRIPLFDYPAVRRDATNAVLRAQAIEGMRAALRDPSIKDNPRELRDLLSCLAGIKAEEAIPEMMPFLFYDKRTKSDFRLRLEDFADPNSDAPPSFDPQQDYQEIDSTASAYSIGWDYLAAITTEAALNSVLSRMAQSTPEERLIGIGGGCIASVARSVLYYYESDRIRGTGGRPRKPWVVIEQWIAAHPDLTPEQVAALNEIAQGTRTWEPDYVPPPAQPPPPPSE